jgi:shikimate kinase
MNKQILIIGFMGTGKSTVARALALKLNCLAVDLDELITERELRGPGEIIKEDGEDRFRELETQMLRKVLTEAVARVIALGGGAWTIARNRKLVADHGAFTVWLDAPFELCWRRIEEGQTTRPLAPSRQVAEKLYFDRYALYQLAHARIVVTEKDSAEEIATRVVHTLATNVHN